MTLATLLQVSQSPHSSFVLKDLDSVAIVVLIRLLFGLLLGKSPWYFSCLDLNLLALKVGWGTGLSVNVLFLYFEPLNHHHLMSLLHLNTLLSKSTARVQLEKQPLVNINLSD